MPGQTETILAHPAPRIDTLDFIRGVAVLGILAINIAGFAGPPISILTPHLPTPGSQADVIAYAIKFVFFEGKMRALFCILFGASMALFMEREEAKGGFPELMQLRRLGWLMLFGLLHYYLLWWGDILFIYALTGILCMFLADLSARTLFVSALVIFAGWHLTGMAVDWPDVMAEQQVLSGNPGATAAETYRQYMQNVGEYSQREIAAYASGFWHLAQYRMALWTFHPVIMTFTSLGEVLPLMMVGMALYKSGFFTGDRERRFLRLVAVACLATGTAATLALLAWAWNSAFPPRLMDAIFSYWAALPHLAMALGYAAILSVITAGRRNGWLHRRLVSAGRMAFSNYILTTIAMTGIFYGWGLGLGGSVGHAEQGTFVVAAWIVMLAWSKFWLDRFKRGPLEWAWRSLAERAALPNRR